MFRKTFFMLSLLAVLFSCRLWAAAPEFSADLTMSMGTGKPMTGKIFVKADNNRAEISFMNFNNITITRQDKKVMWILMPEQKQYREMPAQADPSHPTPDMQFDTKEIGTGQANGYDCKLIQYTFKNGMYGIVVNWFAPQINMPVRVEVKNKNGTVKSTIDYTNIKIGPQADDLFEIPAGYTKM